MDIQNILANQLSNNDFFKGGFILTILAGIGMWLKQIIPAIWSLILRKISYTTTIESKTELYSIFNNWLYENHSNKYRKVLSLTTQENRNNKLIGGTNDYNSDDSMIRYGETNFQSTFYFWHGGLPIFVTSSREKFEASGDFNFMHIDNYTITTYFSKSKIKNLLQGLVRSYNEGLKQKKGSYLYDFKNYNGWENQGIIKTKPLSKIFNLEKEELLTDIQSFFENKEYYMHRGIPYRRGYLCYGSPGNGKTTTITAIAEHLKKDVYNLNLSSINDDEQLKSAFKNLKNDSFLIIEDVDASLNGREKVNKVNFNTLLNVLDGVLSKDNICIFFTTNHKERLDDALLRCGRIDKKIEFKNPRKEDVQNMVKLFFDQDIIEFEYNENMSASGLQEILIQSKTTKEFIVRLENKKITNLN